MDWQRLIFERVERLILESERDNHQFLLFFIDLKKLMTITLTFISYYKELCLKKIKKGRFGLYKDLS